MQRTVAATAVLLTWATAGLTAAVGQRQPEAVAEPERIELFTRSGCPRCGQALRFLDEETSRDPSLTVVIRDVAADDGALERLRTLADRAGIAAPGVPAFYLKGQLVIGFDSESTPERIRSLLAGASGPAADGDVCEIGDPVCEDEASDSVRVIDLPLFGQIDVDRMGLPLFTLVVGLVDGFNPCATWVLLFLLAMLVNLKSRSRMALIAGTFVVVSGIVYFAFMSAWLTFFMVIGISEPIRFVLAALALLIGILNVKDFFALGRGPSASIPDSAKPGFYARVRAILRAEHLSGAMAGIVVLAFLVNLIELLCTAGLPALYTAILTSHELPAWKYYAYLVLYIAAYMLDDAVLVTIGVVTLSKRKLQERGGRWLKLLSGLVILGLGIMLLLWPSSLGF